MKTRKTRIERKIESIEIRFLYTGNDLFNSGGKSYIFINGIFANVWLLGEEYEEGVLAALNNKDLRGAIKLCQGAIKNCDDSGAGFMMVATLNTFIKFLKTFGRI